MDRRLALAFLLCFSLLIPFRVLAQRTSAGNGISAGSAAASAVIVTGTVYNEKGNRTVMQALVQLCDGGGNMLAQEITTDNGEFSFRGLERENYILQVSADGFAPTSASVDLSYNSERGIPIYLKAVSEDANERAASAKVSAHEMSMPKAARDSFAAGKKKMYVDKNPQGALVDFQDAVAAAPGYYEAFHQLALVEIDLGKSADAEANLRKAIEVSGDKYGEADVSLGTVLLDRGQSAEGEKTLRHGIELSPDFWLGHYELGRAMLNQEKLPEALKSGEQARSLSPGTPIIYRLLSNIHLRQEDYAALLQDIDAYVKLDPDSPAGIRAKALREQVAQKVSTQGAPGSKP
jgi:tetratricopeptide (TPR) repeat protein